MQRIYILFTALLLTSSIFAQNLNGECIDERDGREYGTIKIGEQIWMSSNLALKDSNFFGFQVDWFNEDNRDSLLQQYGILYNHETVFKRNRNICPNNWHLPSLDEWDILFNYVGGKEVAADKLKSASNWSTKNGLNQTGFNAYPGGGIVPDGMDFSKSKTIFWSSSKAAYGHGVIQISGGIHTMNVKNSYYYSIRCLQDDSIQIELNDSLKLGGGSYNSIIKESRELSIGDNYSGGIVFYLDSSGIHGLVAKKTDEAEKKWRKAVKSCRNLNYGGYTDWYLPSEDELDIMLRELHLNNLGSFTNDHYWNSLQVSKRTAMVQSFKTYRRVVSDKSDKQHFRAIRAF